MNYCPKCGTKLESDHRFCPSCGYKLVEEATAEVVDDNYSSSSSDTLKEVAKIFMIICTVIAGWAIIPLCWMVPMTVHYSRCVREGRRVGTAFAVCTLLFCSFISGILILIDENTPNV